jgi:hypothetical protein
MTMKLMIYTFSSSHDHIPIRQYLYVPIKIQESTMPSCSVLRPTKLSIPYRFLVIMCAKRPNMHVRIKMLPAARKDHNKNKDNERTLPNTIYRVCLLSYFSYHTLINFKQISNQRLVKKNYLNVQGYRLFFVY